MLLKKWEDIPEFMRNDEVKKYYDVLKKKKIFLILKRIFDIVMSLLMIVILIPVFIVIAIWIKIDSVGPIFYKQKRITQYGSNFYIFKFRTMVPNADKIGSLVTTEGDNRITKVGAKIRKCRLDEIPQLINVLKGEMSFVGTRPEVQKYVSFYSAEMMSTLLIPAGVTSLASINFKDEDKIISEELTINESIDSIYLDYILPRKMVYNLEYMQNLSLIGDLKICVKTILLKQKVY